MWVYNHSRHRRNMNMSQLPPFGPMGPSSGQNMGWISNMLGQALQQLHQPPPYPQTMPPYVPPYMPPYTPTTNPSFPQQQPMPTTTQGPLGLPASPPTISPTKPINPPGTSVVIDANTVKPCMNTCTYVWLKNGTTYWVWMSQTTQDSIYGYYWNGSQWAQFSLPLQQIDYFQCFSC